VRSAPREPGEFLYRDFFAREAETVARALLGAILCRSLPDGSVMRVRIVETEAYVGEHDLACHAARGRTRRTEVMYGAAGHAYVYFVYGMHHMFNVVTGTTGVAQAVLIRAAEPVAPPEGRLDGPARLTRALGIDMAVNKIDVTAPPLCFEAGPTPVRITATTRVGVDYAGDWAAARLRFYDSDSAHVSRR